MLLTFKTNDTPFMKIDLTQTTLKVVEVLDHRAMNIILPERYWSRSGLETMLQFYMNKKQPLDALLADIKENGIHCDFQHNLRIDIE